jgi:hypothetical protein
VIYNYKSTNLHRFAYQSIMTKDNGGCGVLYVGAVVFVDDSEYNVLAESSEKTPENFHDVTNSRIRRWARRARERSRWTIFRCPWRSGPRWYVHVNENQITTIVITTLLYPRQRAVECVECLATRVDETQTALEELGEGEGQESLEVQREQQMLDAHYARRLYNNLDMLELQEEAARLRDQLEENIRAILDPIERREEIIFDKVIELKESAQVFKKKTKTKRREMWIEHIFQEARVAAALSSGAASGSSSYLTSHNPLQAVFDSIRGFLFGYNNAGDVFRYSSQAFFRVVDFFEAEYDPMDDEQTGRGVDNEVAQ